MDDEERLEGEEEMELDDATDGEDEDEEPIGMSISPATSEQLFTGVPVTPENVTPEEPYDALRYQKFPLPGGKPLGIRRGPGRPRKERPLGTSLRGIGPKRSFGRGSNRGKGLYSRGGIRRTKSKDDDTHSESQSPLRLIDDPNGEGESSGMDRSMPAPEEPPYVPEKYPGKVCALCNLGERSQLGQGELIQFTCPVGFTPEKHVNRDETADLLMDVSSTGDKSPRGVGVGPGAVTCRRQKSLAKCRNPSLTNFTEPVEELTIVGHSEEPDIALLFEVTGIYYVHKSCAIWSSSSKEITPESLSPTVVQASSRRCAYCSHYGAGIPCKVGSCNRYFHFPCAAASSSFQDTKSLSLCCSQHLGQVPLLNGDITCMQCYGMGDVSNLVMCSMCGHHYHGSCVGLALLPGVRAGWQCAGCRVCQVCRQPEDASKVMLCEQCDKAYHPGCLRPIVTSIPKYGWKCKCCRVCTDCGSRTPGAGLSSRWHSHYTVCDSCYQQRNKGFSCPLCRKAYRAAAYREMVQCSSCKKFVHGTCDPEADPLTYQHRKEAKPDYEYVCLQCKSMALVKRKDNIDDYGGDSSLTASQESLYGDGDSSEFDYPADDPLYSIGLGKGKPFCASKIAKKRLGFAGLVGRPKGVGKVGYQKRQKLNDFGRKRGPKAKMRGIFGVPGVGLQKPQSDSSKEEEPGVENRLVLCSAKDKFVLTQDICVMCGAIGTDSEGCLIACAQCGQCYHPYCANVKVTKIILQKGWRCLDCTVCEGCGERHDEGRLILCDDCDISYHIYCMDPPLDYVPHGTWKCKWCAQCQTCGSNDPGFNSSWQRNYTQCGPCASHVACASCQEPYNEGDLIIQCVQCERWLHCACDHIKTEAEAEKCAEEGYNCILCRPRDVPPPHMLCNIPKPQLTKFPRSPPPTVRSPELYKPSTQQYLVDGVYLSEAGMHHIKSLTFEQQQTRKKRRKMLPVIDKDADIMATIESVVAGSLDNSLEDHGKLDMDVKDEPNEVYKEGMVWPHSDQPPPDGYSLYTTENGISVLRRKRQRNLQKLGIGGFVVRLRGTRKEKEHEGEPSEKPEGNAISLGDDKPRKKVQRKKQQPKLAESFPLYMQEAFFGKDLMDITKDRDLKSSSDSDSEKNISGNADTIQLSQDEIKAIEQVNTKNAKEKEESKPNDAPVKTEEAMEEDTSDTEALGDILPISTDLLDTEELVNTIMNDEEDLAKASEALDDLDDAPGPSRDELTDILSPHFNLESMVRDTGLPNMDSKDVEEIFKGVLTDESQESQESSSVFPMQAQPPRTPSTTTPLVSPSPHTNLQTGIPLGRPQVPVTLPPVAQSNLNSPMSFPPPSPYHSEYSNSPQFSPAFSEPPSPWVNPDEEGTVGVPGATTTGKQGNNVKMFQDEKLGAEATISSVLYANLMHPEWKEEYPSWPERCKQILKKWRALPNETKAPYLTQARDNRATIRMKKTQQIPKDISSTIQVTATSSPTVMTKPVTSSQINPIVGLTAGQKQLGLLASVVGDKLVEKQGLQGSSVAVATGQTVGLQQQHQQHQHQHQVQQQQQQQQQVAVAHISQGNQLMEVCAVQGPPRQLTTISSPSPSPTSSTSSSPRPNSVNSMTNYIVNVATTPATVSQDNNNTSVTVKLTQSPATLITNVVTQCNSTVVIGHQVTNQLQQQRSNNNINNSSNTTNHITISTSTISNQTLVNNNHNGNGNNQVSNGAANVTSGTIVVAGTVRQFTTVDHQIRVLTPSEIMRTLPSLSQEHYDPPPTAIIHTVPVQNHPAMEQERLSNRDRSTKEAEQERQWKQLQALRQQQAQLQAQVIHEQRTHAITARVHRQLTDDGSQMIAEANTALTTQLQVATSQDGTQLGPMASPSPGASRVTFATPPLKVNRAGAPPSPHPGMPRLPNQQVTRPVGQVIRPVIPSTFTQPPSPFSPQAPQSPHDFPQSPASSQSQEHFQRFDNPDGFSQGNQTPRPMIPGTPTYATSPRNDVFTQPPGTPRPIFNPPTPRTSTHVYAPSRTPDPYSNQPPTPSPAPSYTSPRPEARQEAPPQETFNQQPEVNRQLRDLLQRQQFSKKMEQIPGNWSQEGQTPTPDAVQQQQFEQSHVQMQPHVQQTPSTVEGTFRHPLPPGMRPRMPLQLNVLIRNSQGNLDGRLQGIDPRARMLLQRPQGILQQPQQPQHFQNQSQQNPQVLQQQQPQSQQAQRMPAPRNPMAEQYDILQQTPQVPQAQQIQGQQPPARFADPQQHNQPMQRIIRSGPDINQSVRMISPSHALSRPPLIPTTVNENPSASESSEIPDNVTAELEKLEQEGAPMVEVEGVSAILGDLAEDDDELLAEMGADFNILEYADPELDNITGGEKTNILDMDLEQVEVETKEDKLKKESKVEEHKTEDLGGTTTAHEMGETNATVSASVDTAPPSVQSAPVPVPQMPATSQTQVPQQTQSASMIPQNHPQAVAVQQQMNHHVQQAAAMGRPMPPGTRLLSPDGAIGVVTSSNTVTVSYPSNFPGHAQRIPQQQHLQLQQQRLSMRVPGVQGVPGRVVSVGHMIGPRMPLAPPPPPPPPYPGPPPPYPGPVQMGLCGGRGMPRPPVHIGHQMSVPGPPMAPVVHTGSPSVVPHQHRRPLLLQEQPLLLEDLLEQEKREQEKQQKQQQVEAATVPAGALLSDSDFEMLRADVIGSSALGSPPQGIVSGPSTRPIIRPPGKPRPPSAPGTPWPQVPDTGKLPVQNPRQPIATQTPAETRVATFNISHLPAPPVPPEVIGSEQDRIIQIQYEQWLQHQGQILKQQQTYYDTEVQKLRKVRKSLNSKQRQLRKTGGELTENDALELQRISNEQAILQKQLDASRKQVRQHNMLTQEYQSKQQARQNQAQASESCSPLMSPSQHSSPMHSPAGLVSHSPGPGSSGIIQHSPAASMIQNSPNAQMLQHSPGNPQQANTGTMSPHSMQQSPRIGTPHSQGEESPFSPGAMPSPGMCGPPTRMTSPQHRAVMNSRLVTSPGTFPADGRGSQQMLGDQTIRLQNIHQRFVRPPNVGELVQRPRMQIQGGIMYNQRSPLGSPQPSQQQIITQQQMLQRQIQQHQQQQQQQQQAQHEGNAMSQDQNIINQRNLQMAQQRAMIAQNQQQQQQMQKPPNSPMVSQPANSPSPQMHQQIQQSYGQPPSSPMPRSPMVQQTMGSPMLQQQLSQNSQPPSPMGSRIHHPPTSPMVSQYQPNPPSPMARTIPSTSPMLQHQLNNQHHPPPSQTPSSPMPRSPMVAGSPMQIQRRQSNGNSPAMPDRPQSVENPGTPRTPHTPHYQQSSHSVDQQQSQQQHCQNQSEQPSQPDMNRGGGNPHNPLNPIPFRRNFGRFGFIKLGLRGGSPMWSTKPESSKGKTEPRLPTSSDDKPNTSAVHRKTGISQSKINSLVCADYNDFDDDSHTPPQTPPNRTDSKLVQGSVSAGKSSALSLGSPSDKLEAMPDTTDYDDDKTIVNEEVTLSSTAQRDSDDITVIEEFGESELGDVVLGALDPDMQEEYVLFEQDMVVDLSVDSNDSLSHALVNNSNQSHDIVQILEIQQAHDDTGLSDDELLPTQNRNKKGLRLDIVRTLQSGKRLVTVTDTPESPDQEEIIGHSPENSLFLDHGTDHNFMALVGDSQVVIIDPDVKSPEDHLLKESCGEEEPEKIDCNSIASSQKVPDQVIESSTPEHADKKSPIFNFSEKSQSPVPSAVVSSISEPTVFSEATSSMAIHELTTASPKTAESPGENIVKEITTSLESRNKKSVEMTVSGKVSQTTTKFSEQQKVNSIDVIDGPTEALKSEEKIIETKLTYIKNTSVSKPETEVIVNSVAVEAGKVVANLSPRENNIKTPKLSPVEPEKFAIKTSNEEHEKINLKGEVNSPRPLANCTSLMSEISEEVAEEKKTDPLNTTDELESMLEAIHNPAEKSINGENKKEKSEVSPLQRISPVVDEMSLVNILESDAEPTADDKKEERRDQNAQKIKDNQSLEIVRTSDITEELSSSKPFEDSMTATEDSPEDLLDMLDNIISTKPEMVNADILEEGRSRKSSLIYQLPTPLESLPLNILQDSLMDLETHSSEGEQSSQLDEQAIHQSQTQSKPLVTAESQAPSKSPPPSQPAITTIAVNTVAQLQRSTTTVPHLSPLSQPTELTSNVVNVSHQLRSLLSSLHTNHSQSYTTAGQGSLVTMVSSVSAGAKTSIVVTATGTMLMSSTSTTLNFTKPSVDTTTTFSNQLKDGSNAIAPLNKTSDQFNRISASNVGSTLASLPAPTISSRPGTNSGISITSNAMLNAMLSRTSAAKPSIAGHRASTILTQTSNLLPSALPNPSTPKPQNLQTILQVSSNAPILSKTAPNVSTSNSSTPTGKSIAAPINSNTINVTTSILQSTLSQAPTLLHSQLTSGSTQYKSTGILPIDSKPSDLDSVVQMSKEEENKPQARSEEAPKLPTRMEESQNVLLKQLLQNTACATTAAPSSTSTAPSLPIVPSLEAQLARPTSTPPSSLIPPLLSKIPDPIPPAGKPSLNRETSFVSQVPVVNSQSPPAKEEPPKSTTPVSLSSVPPLQNVQRPMEVVTKQQLQPKVSPAIMSQSISSMALKTSPQGVKLEHPAQAEVTAPVSNTSVAVKSPANDSIATAPQMRVTNLPANFTRLIPTAKPLPPGQKIISQNPQMVNNIQPPSQPSTPVPTTSPQTPQPQIPGAPAPSKPPAPIQMHQQLTQQQLQQTRVQVVNSHQPSVPQKIPQPMGQQHHAHLQQGAIVQPQQPPPPPPQPHTVPLVEVKKEILDEVLSGSTPTNSDTKDFLTAKEEIMDCTIDDKTDLKKLKRRQYQQKRRQSQGKDANAQPQKKRSRKVSRMDEDYDTFIDNLMVQLRQLPQMTVLEPLLGRNYGVCPIFGSGDLSKVANQKDYNTRTGDLSGVYGVARLMGISDHYNTQPFGEQEPLPPQQPASTQRGFYDQEFPPLKLDDTLDKKENMTRDVDTPDTIVSSSSPECVIPEFVHKFPGLRLIDDESDEEADWLKRVSPVIPLVSPIPIRLKPAHIKDNAKQDKENLGTTRPGKSPPVALRENGNVTVTLTLNSQAADDIMGVLKDLANILNIPPPNGYQIVERTTTPPSQKLGLYRTKGKDGKEGAPIDIQSILNGAAKFCRHCDVVILSSLIRKKVSDLPFLSREEAEPGDELCFCSAACYMQFALMHRTPTTQGKAAAIVDHLCSKSDLKLIDNSMKKKLQEKRTIDNKVIGMDIVDMEINVDMTPEVKIKTEKEDLERTDMMDEPLQIEERRPRKHAATDDPAGEPDDQPPVKMWKGVKYKFWATGAIQPATKYKKPTDKEITEMLFRLGVTVSPVKTDDSRRCMFCQNQGDGAADGPARLLNFDVDKWVHLNCALWSEDVYETVNGALMNLDIALQHSLVLNCIVCEKPGATVKCFKIRCTNVYHLGCAVKDGCVFYKNKSTFCAQHAMKNEKDNELTTLSVYRRVYVNRDENRQVAAVMHHSDHNHLLRVGSLIFLSVGQLLPHQLANFHTPHYIYPVGYKIVRFYWSMRRPNKRCRYVCSIHDVSGRPEFRVLVQEPAQEDMELRDATPRAVWGRILQPLAELRKTTNSVQLFPRYVSGEDLFGLTEPAIVRVLESLPGIETLTDYRPKYGRNPLLELPLAINPTGCARAEGRCRNQLPWKRPHTQRTGSSARATYAPAATVAGEVACPYSKQFVHSKSSQYKKMKQDWRNNVYLARSKIQGLGLYAARDLEKHQMVIEYIGEIIRTELAETREKQYEARNRGIYMFRLDEERVVDATLCGGLARYINHSCNPNCVAEIVEVERDLRIIIFAKRRISRGEELAYDYKFDIEDDQHKIACACGAPNCRKWMN